MRRALPLISLALAAAGCGGGTKTELVRPTLPRALASEWGAQADAVAAALAAGDGCTARTKALALRAAVIEAIQTRRIRTAFDETLLSAVTELPQRISCSPAPPAHGPKPHPPHPHPHPHPPKPHPPHGPGKHKP